MRVITLLLCLATTSAFARGGGHGGGHARGGHSSGARTSGRASIGPTATRGHVGRSWRGWRFNPQPIDCETHERVWDRQTAALIEQTRAQLPEHPPQLSARELLRNF